MKAIDKKYETLLFDADDTLLDFKAAEKYALSSLFDELGIPLDGDIEARYSKHNKGMWQELEKGNITREELINTRFVKFFASENIDSDGDIAKDRYFYHLSRCGALLPYALETLDICRRHAKVYIISNGVALVQDGRFAISGIIDHADGVFISERVGYQKPRVEFFNEVEKNIPGFRKETALVIGDSLTADIAGGIAFGVDTCHVCPVRMEYTEIKPDYSVTDLKELLMLLGYEITEE